MDVSSANDLIFVSKPDKLNLLAHFVELSFFYGSVVLFNYSLFFSVVILILFLFFVRIHWVEPVFVRIDSGEVTFRSFWYFFSKTVRVNEIIGFSSIKKPYFNHFTKTLHPCILIYFADNSRKLIVNYHFENFREVIYHLKLVGVKNLGKDLPEWTGYSKIYKFDQSFKSKKTISSK
jgi:hypothetical protein